ncbi:MULTISPECIES: IS21 family transposase [Bacilli]|uniref:Transposase n=12 Tax=Staphylococcus aureus TaxID=1280 RepID=D2JAL2_STAAU|nr:MULTISPECIES: IS21 family transposase [Bacilli]MDU5986131.1 IS21 family transposase [Cutibacterium avidum]HDH6193975.1 IS21 family transposase [Staphylococcus aureus LTCF-16-66]HDH6199345.1 IS21 family transposase [Staphylococcus aureus LTCF-15-63]HDH6210577.1 IS21 family transposase [Staphylococcus aureus LTCF-14-59]HDH6279951.1 IS21 family transposase [Staphylococcus aureus LTCF-4-24]HDH6494231.1 IS21 family transposase [Staphylococcus aureus MRSA-Lux-7]HDK8547177.1 IS21 family transpos
MRHDIYEGVLFYIMKGIKPNYAELGRQYNCDPRTVKKYYEAGKENELERLKKRQQNKKASKLDPFKEIINKKIELGCTAMAIFKYIEKKGYEGKYTILREYCKNKKQNETKKATIRVETNPGIAAQVDWKEDMVMHDKFGRTYQFNIFLYVLHYSKMKYITLTWDRKQDTLFECLKDAFEYTEGVPKEIWFDNMRTVVDRPRTQYKKVVFNNLFYQFSKDANFEPIACRPYRPQTKGSVESLAKFVEQRLRPYDYEFYDAVELIGLVNDLCHELNHLEISQATEQRPIDVFNYEEKEHLNSFNAKLLDTYIENECIRIVSKESMINFRKGKYSVPTKYIGEEVQVIFNNSTDELLIYYDGELIRRHNLSERKFNYIVEDMSEILKSDVFKHKDDKEILTYIENSLLLYDEI